MQRKNTLAERRWTSRFILFGIFLAVGFTTSVVKRSTMGTDLKRKLAATGGDKNLTACPPKTDYRCGDVCSKADDETYEIIKSDYPSDPFTAEECDNGALILHILGLLYMFLGLSIICDEFFVPALEELTFNRLKLDADVAGATFMAAGGSAPELATSFIGTFTGSSVGFGTIVGSAVFNVLFVIGACAMASKDVLTLTSYPLARDALWYTISLGLLAYFFANEGSEAAKKAYPGKTSFIEFPEACVQFLLYIGYVIIMWKNLVLKRWYYRTFYPGSVQSQGEGEKDIEMTSANPMAEGPDAAPAAAKATTTDSSKCSSVRTMGNFNAGLFRLMTQQTTMEETLAAYAIQEIEGNMRETFDALDEEKNGMIEIQNVRHLLERMGTKPTQDQVEKYMAELDTDKSGDVSFEEFSAWYLKGEARIEAELTKEFAELDTNNDGVLDVSELRVLMDRIGPEVDEAASIKRTEDVIGELDLDHNGKISQEEFCGYYRNNMAFLDHKKKEQAEELEMAAKADENVDMLAWPADADIKGKAMYIVALPLVFLFCCTIPDVRQESKLFGKPKKDYYLFSFFMSIAMVGGLSYVMVWLAVTIGKQWGIPDEIMGLTFLAAGTSVPDLLTSVMVAMQGEGDMAVSSSIGSNIFDVTVGLPLPWVVYTAAKSTAFPVGAVGVGTSIVILIAMLAAVIFSIAMFGWKMTTGLGYTMFMLYILYVIQDLFRNPTLNWCEGCQVINF
jgi:sodium/potassium/calcium exchanger 2